jgi:hypothetical protein
VSEIVEDKSIVVPPAERPGLTAEQRAAALFRIEHVSSACFDEWFLYPQDGRCIGTYDTKDAAQDAVAVLSLPIARAIAAAEQQAYTAGVHISRLDIAKQVRDFARNIRVTGGRGSGVGTALTIAAVVESIADGLEGKHRPLVTVAR